MVCVGVGQFKGHGCSPDGGDLKQDGGRRDRIGEFPEIFMPVLELDWRMRNMKTRKLMPRFPATVSGWVLGPLTQKWNRRAGKGLCER